jgi:PAS domain-containing protein
MVGQRDVGPTPLTDARIRELAIAATGMSFTMDGSTFWNEVTISPMLDDAGELTHFVGIQADVTARVEAGAERDRALEAERTARWPRVPVAG